MSLYFLVHIPLERIALVSLKRAAAAPIRMCSSWTRDTGAGVAQHVSFCEHVCCERVLPGFPGSCQLYSDSPFAFIFRLQRKKPSSFELDTNLLAQIFLFKPVIRAQGISPNTSRPRSTAHTPTAHGPGSVCS